MCLTAHCPILSVMISKKILLIGAGGFIAGLAVSILLQLNPHADHHHQAAAPPVAKVELFSQPLRGVDNQPVTLAALADGRPLLVNFWASWCAPCLREIPLLQQAEREHRIKTVGISYEDLPVIKNFSARHGVTYPLYKSSFDIFYFMQAQGNRAAVLPYTVLLDENGTVLRQKIGDFKTAEEITAFAQISAPPPVGEQN